MFAQLMHLIFDPQEIIVYLSMLLQTEPKLFHGMLRLRVGLIVQVYL